MSTARDDAIRESVIETSARESLGKLHALGIETLRETGRIAWADRFFYAIVGIHALAAVILLVASGQRASLAFSAYAVVWPLVFLIQFPFIYLLLGVLQVVHRFDRRRGLAFRKLLSTRRISHFAAGLGLLLALMVFQGAFTSFKNVFPLWAGGFPFDTTFAGIDSAIHYGQDPWRILHRFDSGILTAIVDWNYDHGWFVLCYVALFAVAVVPEAARIRTRYMLTYVATWIIVGNVLAGLFPAAGPAFYGHVTGDSDRFAPLLASLSENGGTTTVSMAFQDYLWSLYSNGQPGFGSGISAFPSMHVALITMNALFAWEWKRRLGLVAFAYVGFVALSSVYLGWHYAIDGYAAIVITVVVYAAIRRWATGKTSAPDAAPVSAAAASTSPRLTTS
jgi:hypothetical protein